jgi:hypothetical protein
MVAPIRITTQPFKGNIMGTAGNESGIGDISLARYVAQLIRNGQLDDEIPEIASAINNRANQIKPTAPTIESVTRDLNALETEINAIVVMGGTVSASGNKKKARAAVEAHGKLQAAKNRLDALPQTQAKDDLHDQFTELARVLLVDGFGINP